MEIGALKKKTFQVWVPFDDDTEVLIEYQPPEVLRALKKEATTTAWDRGHQKEERYDEGEGNRLLGRAAVKNWQPRPDKKGFTMDGEPYSYSPENCDFLMQKYMDFSNFVNAICVDLHGLVSAEKARTIKNCSITSGQK